MKVLSAAVLMSGVFLSGCAPPASQGGFGSDNPASLLYAIHRAGREGDRHAVKHLVQALEHDDPAVRMMAIHALDLLTGHRLGYNPYAPALERQKMVEKWVGAVDEVQQVTQDREVKG